MVKLLFGFLKNSWDDELESAKLAVKSSPIIMSSEKLSVLLWDFASSGWFKLWTFLNVNWMKINTEYDPVDRLLDFNNTFNKSLMAFVRITNYHCLNKQLRKKQQ